MRVRRAAGLLALAMLGMGPGALAQSSANHRVEGSTFNAGGRPSAGQFASSASFAITLDAVGEAVPAGDAAGPSFAVSGSTTGIYAPSAEVQGLTLDPPGYPAGTIGWAPMSSAVLYNVYRGATGTLPGTFGSCLASNVPTTSYSEGTLPAARSGYYYLITGENRLGEEGTKGYQSNGIERTSSPACP